MFACNLPPESVATAGGVGAKLPTASPPLSPSHPGYSCTRIRHPCTRRQWQTASSIWCSHRAKIFTPRERLRLCSAPLSIPRVLTRHNCKSAVRPKWQRASLRHDWWPATRPPSLEATAAGSRSQRPPSALLSLAGCSRAWVGSFFARMSWPLPARRCPITLSQAVALLRQAGPKRSCMVRLSLCLPPQSPSDALLAQGCGNASPPEKNSSALLARGPRGRGCFLLASPLQSIDADTPLPCHYRMP